MNKHKFYHRADGSVTCEHCGLERQSWPMPAGYRWKLNGQIIVKKPKCISYDSERSAGTGRKTT